MDSRGARLTVAAIALRMAWLLMLSFFLVSLASGVWASPSQSRLRQTVPTRTPIVDPTDTPVPPTDEPTDTPELPTSTPEAPTATPQAPTEVPTAEPGTPAPEEREKPSRTPTPTEAAPARVTTEPSAEPLPTGTLIIVPLADKDTLALFVKPTATPTPTATPLPATIPGVLVGKIAFKSDMLGKQRVFVVDPEGGNLSLLVKPWIYDVVVEKERISPNGVYGVYAGRGVEGQDLFLGPLAGGPRTQLTFVGNGKAYDPAFSPAGHTIVFASNQEVDDDIFAVEFCDMQAPRPRTVKLTHRDTWESDKHPSYSPDAAQIVFYSNRTGVDQIWVMNADGSGARQLFETESRCWDPVWIKPHYAAQ